MRHHVDSQLALPLHTPCPNNGNHQKKDKKTTSHAPTSSFGEKRLPDAQTLHFAPPSPPTMPALTSGDAAVVTALRKLDLDVQSRLGQGSFGIVYRAYDHLLHINVAVKALQMAKAKQTSSIRYAPPSPPPVVAAQFRSLSRVRGEMEGRRGGRGGRFFGGALPFWGQSGRGRCSSPVFAGNAAAWRAFRRHQRAARSRLPLWS